MKSKARCTGVYEDKVSGGWAVDVTFYPRYWQRLYRKRETIRFVGEGANYRSLDTGARAGTEMNAYLRNKVWRYKRVLAEETEKEKEMAK